MKKKIIRLYPNALQNPNIDLHIQHHATTQLNTPLNHERNQLSTLKHTFYFNKRTTNTNTKK